MITPSIIAEAKALRERNRKSASARAASANNVNHFQSEEELNTDKSNEPEEEVSEEKPSETEDTSKDFDEQLDAIEQEASRSHAKFAKNNLASTIQTINDRHFIARLGNKIHVVEDITDPNTGHWKPAFLSEAAFLLKFRNKFIEVDDQLINIGQRWLSHPDRREYDCIELIPNGKTPDGVYNMWKGFAVKPIAGDCEPELRHILMVICAGNRALFKYLVRWLAYCVQHPDKRPEVAIVMRGEEGTGKGTLAQWMLLIFGAHGFHVTEPEHLVGRFTGHLRATMFLFADEAFFAGNHTHVNNLKGRITEPTITVESKGVDAVAYPSYLKIMMATNDQWAVRAGKDARRFCVLDVSNVHKQDHAYFARLNEHANNGGLAALLAFLLNLDLTGFNVRQAPITEALTEQKVLSLPPFEQWVYNWLYESDEDGWACEIQRDTIVYQFRDYIKTHRNAAYANTSSVAVGKAINRIFTVQSRQKRVYEHMKWHWVFPNLPAARRQFEQNVLGGGAGDWPVRETETEEG